MAIRHLELPSSFAAYEFQRKHPVIIVLFTSPQLPRCPCFPDLPLVPSRVSGSSNDGPTQDEVQGS